MEQTRWRLVDRHIKQEILDCCRSVQYGLNFNTQGTSAPRSASASPIFSAMPSSTCPPRPDQPERLKPGPLHALLGRGQLPARRRISGRTAQVLVSRNPFPSSGNVTPPAPQISGPSPRRKDETTYASYPLRSSRAPDQCDSAVSSISVLDAAGSSAASASI